MPDILPNGIIYYLKGPFAHRNGSGIRLFAIAYACPRAFNLPRC